jgi:hypothetical protein
MNRKFYLASLPVIALAASALGATADFYVNDGLVMCPPSIAPQVDATNFVNNNVFNVSFTNNVFYRGEPYRVSSAVNYTNNGLMAGNTGFEFDTRPPGAGVPRMAANFVNRGTISCGSVNNTNTVIVDSGFFFSTAAYPRYVVSATNVVLSSSTNIVGFDGLFKLNGRNVNLNRANVTMEGYDTTFNNALFTSAGIFDTYWGIGNTPMNPAFQFEIAPPETPVHQVANTQGPFLQLLSLPSALFYVDEEIVGTNRFVQAVFLSDTNASVTKNVYFPGRGLAVVEWSAMVRNAVTGQASTNYLYLYDDFGAWFTNMLVQRYYVPSGQPTYVPWNYYFFRGGPFFWGPPSQPAVPTGFFNFNRITNEYSAYAATFSPATQLPGNLPGLTLTNMPGRIEISAANSLDLTRARISGPNYFGLRATNHFVGSSRAEIAIPYNDIALATTNGRLVITNLLAPAVQRFTGEVDLWSGRWTNNEAFFQSTYSVLFVDSRLSREAAPVVQDLSLRSTNVFISDVLNVTRTCLIDATHVTIVTNQLGAIPPAGELNFLSSQIVWPAALPRLQYLTNAGALSAMNAMFLGGSRSTPFFTSNYNEPYQALVNSGRVTAPGLLIWANYFENSGLFDASTGYGSINLQARNARLTNGFFLARGGDISVTSGDLIVTNSAFQTGRKLTLLVTNLLTDVASSNANFWSVGGGLDVPVRPAAGDLLGTTLFDKVGLGMESTHNWGTQDRGAATTGYANNVALGRLLLDGDYDSQFTFTGTGTDNALYVDYLELRGYATNKDTGGNLLALQVDPNMRVYYAEATINGVSHAEKLNGANGGRLRWVPTYAGTYSSTPVVYLDGTTNWLNAALVASKNLDSDGDGAPNNSDPEPVFVPSQYHFTAALAGAPGKLALQWQTIGSATNSLFVTTNLVSPNWQLVTSFVSAPVVGPPTNTQVSVPLGPGNCFYRVRVDADVLR